MPEYLANYADDVNSWIKQNFPSYSLDKKFKKVLEIVSHS